ncbi:hypothetical protein IT072_08850 [Leifsonia sp. ZF2019]|nr:hypothetical protein [Leifsonia sp. ZF2019]UAJ81075.1 hypothetical protein IT072_08850 [Leifsonia sp. ZF2019]
MSIASDTPATDFAASPLPPAGDRLLFRVEAGERLPLDRGGRQVLA